ncbi:MAG: rhomboid family intramembrane serine protease [Chloroflexi bacterium]|nr:rhomboid family intramembrane serine protease [Chloroflexota bacterium]
MLPLRVMHHRRQGLAIITLAIILTNVVVFLFELSLGANVDDFIRTYGAVPREILTGQDLLPTGPRPIWMQLLTSMFVHAGWLHLLGNMVYLRAFGDDIEDAFGCVAYLLFYLGAGIFASLVHIFVSGAGDTTPSVGASGAIAGILGAYLVLFPRRHVQVLMPSIFLWTTRMSALALLGFWFFIQFLNGMLAMLLGVNQSEGIAVWAHISGFVAGALVAVVWRGMTRVRRHSWMRV